MKEIFERILLWFFSPSNKQLQQLHNTLFDFFLPYDGNDPLTVEAIRKAKRVQFEQMRDNTAIRWVIALIYKPHRLLKVSWIKSYYKHIEKFVPEERIILQEKNKLRSFLEQTGVSAFIKMNDEQKLRFINLLVSSDINFYRRIGAGLRVYYIVNVYRDEVGRLIAGIGDYKLDAFAPDPDISLPQFSSHLSYEPGKEELKGEVDYIVIGTGPSGCLVASELHKAGHKVVVVESGSFFMPGTFDGRAGLYFYEDRGFRTTLDGGVFVLNGSSVGGGATVNVDMAFMPSLPTIRSRFDLWRERGYLDNDFWTQEMIAKAHAKVLKKMNTRQVDEHEVNIHNNILKEGAEKHGLKPSFYRLNTYAPGNSPYKRTDKIGPVEQYLIGSMQSKENPLTLIPDAEVQRLILRGDKAEGIEFCIKHKAPVKGVIKDPCKLGLPSNKTIRLKAKNVVVAGGNLGTSLLLKRSGITNNMLGKGFVMHPFILVLGLFDKPIDNHLGTQSSIYVGDYLTTHHKSPKADFLLESASARPEIAAMLMPGNPKQVLDMVKNYRYMGGFGVLLIEEMNPENRVEISKSGTPEIHYHLSEKDLERFRHGVAEAIRIMFKGGAKKVVIPSFEHLSGDPTENEGFNTIYNMEEAEAIAAKLKFRSNETLLFAAHMMGGVKLSKRETTGCVDQKYKLYGTQNVYVVDSSIFPSSVGANPMETIYTTAQVFADTHLNHVSNN